MICKKCDGSGMIKSWFKKTKNKCEACDGVGCIPAVEETDAPNTALGGIISQGMGGDFSSGILMTMATGNALTGGLLGDAISHHEISSPIYDPVQVDNTSMIDTAPTIDATPSVDYGCDSSSSTDSSSSDSF